MITGQNMRLPFMKMHGLGNDFVVIDRRSGGPEVTAELSRALADRHRGVGFDQLAVIVGSDTADAEITFFNADGSHSAACGNATRCIARFLMNETGRDRLVLKTERGLLQCEDAGENLTRVNMGLPLLNWQDIPLASDVDTLHLPIDGDPVAIDLETCGLQIENRILFPQRTNVQCVQVLGPSHLRMRVWERGTGITLASGSSSCAVAVASHRRGLTGRRVSIDLDGGRIEVEWCDDGVWMTGPTAHVFDGVWRG